MRTHGRGFAAREIRYLVAGAVALGGLGLLGWTVAGQFKEREFNRNFRERGPGEPSGGPGLGAEAGQGLALEGEDALDALGARGIRLGDRSEGDNRGEQLRTRTLGGPPVNTPPRYDEYRFPRVRSADDVASMMDEVSFAVGEAASPDDALPGVELSKRTRAADVVRAFLQPLMAGDRERFRAAVEQLGGEPGGEGGAADSVYDRLSVLLEHASVDAERVSVLPVVTGVEVPGLQVADGRDESEGGPVSIPMSISMSVNDFNGVRTRSVMASMPLDGVFPSLAGWRGRGEDALEVFLPARRGKGGQQEPEYDLGLMLAWVEGGWQPASVTLHLRDASLMKVLMPKRDEVERRTK